MPEDLVKYLSKFITEKRLNTFYEVIKHRTRYITVVLEDIYQPHNASAVLRSCDCFGIQDIHIIENDNKYRLNPDVALGSSKWINLIKHNELSNNSLSAIQLLKKSGYRIIATTLQNNKITMLEDFDLGKGKVALFFGTEMRGLSKTIISNADEFLQIPMHGFTESLNISVAAAISIQHLTTILHQSKINWQLKVNEKNEILRNWLRASIKNYEMLEKRYYIENPASK
ncbi:TrmH family RNA methyltransferase [Bacteroidota bacterium]